MELFEAKITYLKWVEGSEKAKRATETYVLESFNFSDSEAIVTKIIMDDKLEDAKIKNIKPVVFSEIFYDGDATTADDENKWYKTKLSVNVDDGKKMKQTVLVKGTSIENALSVLKLKMKDTLADWDSISITETDIYEVILK